MAITQITNNVILDGTILPAKLNVSANMRTFLGNETISTINGGTGANDDLTLQGTTNATRTTSYVLIQPNGGNVGIGVATPTVPLDVNGISRVTGLYLSNSATSTAGGIDNNGNGSAGLWFNNFSTIIAGYNGIMFRSSLASTAGQTERMRITNSGQIGVGTASPNSSAILDLSSTSRGFLPPRMNQEERTAISSPAAGLVVYTSDLFDLSLYNGTAWGDILTTHSGSFTSNTLATALSDENGSGGGFVRSEGATLSSLGLSSIQQSAIDRIYSNQTVVGSPAAAFFDDFLGNTATDLNWELSFLSPSFTDQPSQSSVNAFGLVRFNTSTGNGSFRGYLLRAYGGTPQGAITEVCFAMPTFSSMSCFAGLTRAGSNASLGVTADTDINSGRWTFLSSGSASSVLITGASLPTGATPRDGDFVIGKKYRVRTEILSVTGANIRILECDATSNSWSTVFDGIIQTPTQDRTLGQGSPLFSVRNKSNQLNRILITDWFSYSNPTFIR